MAQDDPYKMWFLYVVEVGPMVVRFSRRDGGLISG
jgi:hypothetical protein